MVIRSLDEVTGSTGEEILERSHLDESDVLDILQGLLNTGLLEAYVPGADVAMLEQVRLADLRRIRFEVNPGFAQELKQSMRRAG
jgi:hypothetical protein